MSKSKIAADKAVSNIAITAKIDNKPVSVVMNDVDIKEAPYVLKSIASNIYENVYNPNISIRDSFDRSDYEQYRPDEYIPKDSKGKINACMQAYKESGNGIIKNIVDLIADLVVQGIDVVHKKKKNQKFAQAWFHKMVNGPAISERLVNLLCRAGSDIIKRDTGKINLNKVRKLYKGEAAIKEAPPAIEIVKREIPVKYTFLDPRIIDVFQPELTMFLDNSNLKFVLNIPQGIVRAVQYPKNEQEKQLIAAIPTDITNSIRKGNKFITLDSSKLRSIYYKKDDWEVWADPMIFPVLSDLRALQKMKLSDLAAVDGVLSQIRVWKLGSMEHKQRTSREAMSRLANILMNAASGGILDIIWTDDIDCKEISSNLHQFLGESKYTPILNAIYAGLGVPPLFTGVSSQGSFTNNFLAIKTFIVRLEYLRDKLKEFWNTELELLQKAMEWDSPPILVFDRMTLNDESSILNILIHMVDRGILSDEAMQEMVGAMPEVEEFRIKREWKDKQGKKRPPKAGPFNNPDFENQWIDKFIQTGEIAPSQVGIELQDKKPNDIIPNKEKAKREPKVKPMPNDIGGRPVGKKDVVKRKQKIVKPQRGVSKQLIANTVKANELQYKINEYLTPRYLQLISKKNLRQLTEEEFNNFEKLKFGILVNINENSKFSEELVDNLLKAGQVGVPTHIVELVNEMINQYRLENNIEPTTDIIRQFQAITYATDSIAADNSSDSVS